MKQRIAILATALIMVSQLALAKTITGTVVDAVDDEPLIGVSVLVKNTTIGTTTDMDGHYSIDVPDGKKTLVFRYVGMKPQEIDINKAQNGEINVSMTADTELEEVVVTGMGQRKKITVTGAITTVDVEAMKHISTSNLSNALAGNVPGVIAMQTSGQPGKNKSEFWIRGISTFGASSSAYILVDGFERENIDDLNIEDIENFTVLKDASATAIYGSKGANGVVLITTKHGTQGKIKVNAKFETSYNTRTQTPEFVDGLTYASLLNEANITRSKGVYFTPTELELFANGLDPDLYPNVDWKNLLLKDGAWSYRANININGGGPYARYYASISYTEDEGMYKTDNTLRDRYSTNANYRRWNYRVNLDIDATPTTLIRIGTSGDLSLRNAPGYGDGDVWSSLFGYNAILTPIMYSNGYVPMINMGRDDARTNPWVMSTQEGYRREWNNNIQNNISIDQDLKFVTPGLKFSFRFGYDTYNYNSINMLQKPDRWYANGRDNATGELIFDKIKDKVDMYQESANNGSRRTFVDVLLTYNRDFGPHNVGGTLKYTYDESIATQNIGSDIKNSIARKNMALAGQIVYNYDYRYFVDVNFGYNGSENFAKGHRFGFFPAASAAWNVANEPFLRDVSWMNLLKVRASWGKVGNDAMATRFPYIYTIDYLRDGDGNYRNMYNFGDIWNPTRDAYQQGMHFTSLASSNVTWEVSTKFDVGIDINIFNGMFTLTADYFHEKRTGIFMLRNFLPGSMGLESSPWANVGAVKSQGFDGNFGYTDHFGEVSLTVRGNITYSKNTILDYDVENNTYPYQYQRGYRVDQQRGLVALGLFKDYDDIRNSPKQMFGDVQPGDIKYKDVNGDGIIDDNDQVAIGATSRPNLIYGVGVSVGWRGLDFNVLFQGAGKSSIQISGMTVWAFSQDRYGQILNELVKDRWIDNETASQLGIPANENPDATYPRLVHLENGVSHNNYRPSSYWLRSSSYLRLKNLEVGYNLPRKWMDAIHFENVRFFLQCNNLLTFSNFKLWDPEMGSTNGEAYPLTKSVTLGVQISL